MYDLHFRSFHFGLLRYGMTPFAAVVVAAAVVAICTIIWTLHNWCRLLCCAVQYGYNNVSTMLNNFF